MAKRIPPHPATGNYFPRLFAKNNKVILRSDDRTLEIDLPTAAVQLGKLIAETFGGPEARSIYGRAPVRNISLWISATVHALRLAIKFWSPQLVPEVDFY